MRNFRRGAIKLQCDRSNSVDEDMKKGSPYLVPLYIERLGSEVPVYVFKTDLVISGFAWEYVNFKKCMLCGRVVDYRQGTDKQL